MEAALIAKLSVLKEMEPLWTRGIGKPNKEQVFVVFDLPFRELAIS